MKKYLTKISLAILSLAVFTACEEGVVNYNQGSLKTLAEFSKGTASVLAYNDGSPSNFYVQVGVSTVSNVDRAIYYEIDKTATTAADTQYTIDAPGVAVIPAGSYFGKINVAGVLANLTDAKVHLVLNLTGLTAVGGDPNSLDKNVILTSGRTRTDLTIYKACKFVSSVVENTAYKGVTSASEDYSNNSGTFNHSPDPVLYKITDNEFKFTSLWGKNFLKDFYGYKDTDENGNSIPVQGSALGGKVIINEDQTLTFKDLETATLQSVLGAKVTNVTGYYDACNNAFHFHIEATFIAAKNPAYGGSATPGVDPYLYSNMTSDIIVSPK